MKKGIITIISIWVINFAFSQNLNYDSIELELKSAKTDKEKLNYLATFVWKNMWSFPDSAQPYVQQEILLAKEINDDSALAIALTQNGVISYLVGNFPEAIRFCLEGLEIAERSEKINAIGVACHYLTEIYIDAGDYERGIFYSSKSRLLYESLLKQLPKDQKASDITRAHAGHLVILAKAFEKSNQPDSALEYMQLADTYIKQLENTNWATVPYVFGNIYFRMGGYDKALVYYRMALEKAVSAKERTEIFIGIAKIFRKAERLDSAIYYVHKGLEESRSVKFVVAKYDALVLLSDIYKSVGNTDSSAKYLELALAVKDSLFSQQKIMQLQGMNFNDQLRKQGLLDQAKAHQNKVRMYLLIGGLIVLFIVASILYRNNQQKQKAKTKIEKAYSVLKSTQQQLIHSEKMASLGELTAGIAHEIQNPLNFVNNFSEVNKELIEELKIEKSKVKSERDDELENQLLNDLEQNLEKINHHGKRADAIVKGMLQHSRSSSGVKEPTDINALADEYLRLAYHGMRAKDKSFNATIKTDYDETIGNINVIPQDIGRVILNLINNAFYAASLPSKGGFSDSDKIHDPTVWVSTKKMGHKVFISVRDNGPGIPQKILDKIFQPFFTTKPTGQGTGLGLSLAYDIVKVHGGELKVETKDGVGSEFIIQLPVV